MCKMVFARFYMYLQHMCLRFVWLSCSFAWVPTSTQSSSGKRYMSSESAALWPKQTCNVLLTSDSLQEPDLHSTLKMKYYVLNAGGQAGKSKDLGIVWLLLIFGWFCSSNTSSSIATPFFLVLWKPSQFHQRSSRQRLRPISTLELQKVPRKQDFCRMVPHRLAKALRFSQVCWFPKNGLELASNKHPTQKHHRTSLVWALQ